MDEAAVHEHVERSLEIIESSPNLDEQNTKAKLIRPLIELLDWDIFTTEVQLEYPVTVGSGTHKVDFALQLGDSPVAFIEAKGVRRQITDDDVGQLRSYMRQELSVDWGMITNGMDFEILTKGGIDNPRGEVSLASFELGDLSDNPELIEILSKDSIQSGKSEELATKIEQTSRIIEQISDQREGLATEVSDAISRELGEEVPVDVEAQAIGFIDDLIYELEDQRVRIEERSDESPAEKEEIVGDYVVQVGVDEVTIEADGQTEAMVDTVNYLMENYDLLSKIEPLPYVPGRKKAIINDEPYYPDGEQKMMHYGELRGGYYLDAHMNKAGKKRELRRLAEICNVDLNFSGGW